MAQMLSGLWVSWPHATMPRLGRAGIRQFAQRRSWAVSDVVYDMPRPDIGLESSDAEDASADRAQPDAEAEPVAEGQVCPPDAQAVEPRDRPKRKRINEAPSPAPTVGAVRDLPDAALGEAIGFRTPSVVLDGVAVAG